jgi:hypothetical protein
MCIRDRREGEQSPSWASAINVADDIINILISDPPSMRYERVMQMCPHIESVLSSSGVLSNTTMSLVRKMAESAEHCQTRKAPLTSPMKSARASLHMVYNKDALDYAQEDAESFKALAVGTWLQLESSAGRFSPIKLAWVSPLSSRLMFVNRRGVRALVVSVEELAQMKKQGKLIVHAQDNVFEQSMDRVLSRLKSHVA